jgi:hypothetical protein
VYSVHGLSGYAVVFNTLDPLARILFFLYCLVDKAIQKIKAGVGIEPASTALQAAA